ncbi:hypothetical protein E4T56_gene11302, partial [Termitomyces sp. T112]
PLAGGPASRHEVVMTKPMNSHARTAFRMALGLSAALLLTSPALAQRSMPTAIPVVQGVPDAKDVPYPGGTITLDIDATDIARGLFRVTQNVPVAPGTKNLILQLPQWVPGGHSPRGTIDQLVDVKFYADGKLLHWWRDPVEVFAFHVDVPAGARSVVAKFVHTSPLQSSEGRITMTPEMLNLQWNLMSLYPAGYYTRQIKYKPTVTFPEGWQVAAALDGKQVSGNKVTWDVIDYEALVDSPIFAGANFKRFDLGRGVFMNVVADKPELLDIKPEHLATYKALVEEAWANFGALHFDHYDFLLALTDRMGGIGLEHHRSSENAMMPKAWTEWKDMDWARNVISHEFTHSWDGKFRRPDKLWTPDYRQPISPPESRTTALRPAETPVWLRAKGAVNRDFAFFVPHLGQFAFAETRQDRAVMPLAAPATALQGRIFRHAHFAFLVEQAPDQFVQWQVAVRQLAIARRTGHHRHMLPMGMVKLHVQTRAPFLAIGQMLDQQATRHAMPVFIRCRHADQQIHPPAAQRPANVGP